MLALADDLTWLVNLQTIKQIHSTWFALVPKINTFPIKKLQELVAQIGETGRRRRYDWLSLNKGFLSFINYQTS